MSSYLNQCSRCGAYLDPGERCTCLEENRHRTRYQRQRENYEITERSGGFTHVETVRTDRRIS